MMMICLCRLQDTGEDAAVNSWQWDLWRRLQKKKETGKGGAETGSGQFSDLLLRVSKPTQASLFSVTVEAAHSSKYPCLSRTLTHTHNLSCLQSGESSIKND